MILTFLPSQSPHCFSVSIPDSHHGSLMTDTTRLHLPGWLTPLCFTVQFSFITLSSHTNNTTYSLTHTPCATNAVSHPSTPHVTFTLPFYSPYPWMLLMAPTNTSNTHLSERHPWDKYERAPATPRRDSRNKPVMRKVWAPALDATHGTTKSKRLFVSTLLGKPR